MARRRRSLSRPTPSSRFKPGRTCGLSFIASDADYQRFRRMLFDLIALDRNLSDMMDVVARSFGLTRPQHMLMMIIANAQGDAGISVQTAAEYLQVAGSFVTAQSRALVAKGLLAKHADAADGRKTLLRLTAKGERYIERATPLARTLNDAIFGSLEGGSFEGVARAFHAMAESSSRARFLAMALVGANKPAAVPAGISPLKPAAEYL